MHRKPLVRTHVSVKESLLIAAQFEQSPLLYMDVIVLTECIYFAKYPS
jgi:hypothetical protein